MLINPTIGPGGPAWPGGPFKPCSPWEKTKQVIHHLFFELVFHYGLLSLTAGPGMPLSPCGPDFPGCPWGPTGPVFPMRPSKPGLPWKQTALGDHLKLWLFGVSYFCFSPLLLSTLLFLPCLVFPSDPEGQNFKNLSVWICHTGAAMLTCKKKPKTLWQKIHLTPKLNRKWGFRSCGRCEDTQKHTNPSSRRSKWSRFSSCSWKSLKKDHT